MVNIVVSQVFFNRFCFFTRLYVGIRVVMVPTGVATRVVIRMDTRFVARICIMVATRADTRVDTVENRIVVGHAFFHYVFCTPVTSHAFGPAVTFMRYKSYCLHFYITVFTTYPSELARGLLVWDELSGFHFGTTPTCHQCMRKSSVPLEVLLMKTDPTCSTVYVTAS